MGWIYYDSKPRLPRSIELLIPAGFPLVYRKDGSVGEN